MKKHVLIFLALVVTCLSLNSCWVLAAAGVGAAGGYIARDKGVKIQPPVTNDGGGDGGGQYDGY